MKNKKGFTLTELLVAMVILGIVVGMSFPVVRRIREANEKREYEAFSNSITFSSKLYIDSYSEDLFGREKSGCVYITYEMLKNKNLTKDININDLSCYSDNTFIKVIKLNDRYSYTPYLGCGDDKDGNKISKVTVIYPTAKSPYVVDTETCNGIPSGNFQINAVPASQAAYQKQAKTSIEVTSPTGILNSVNIEYAWNTTKSTNGISSWTKGTFSVPVHGQQEESILATGKSIKISSQKISAPSNGSFYLIVKINNLEDLYGAKLSDEVQYKMFGPFNVDTLPPTISKFDIASTTTNYNNKKVKLSIKGSDNITKESDLKICLSTTDSCTNYEKYSTSKEFDIGGKYDGKEKTIYIFMKDEAGNIGSTNKKYTVYKECQDDNLVVDGKWSKDGSCSKKCGEGKQKYKGSSKDKNSGSSCTKELEKTETCKEHDCCADVTYKDGKTCSVECGTGTYNRLAYDKYDTSMRCPDKDKSSGGSKCTAEKCPSKEYTLTLDANGGKVDGKSSITKTIKANTKYGSNVITPTRNGYKFVKWMTYDGENVTSDTVANKNRVAKAVWQPYVLKIKYRTPKSAEDRAISSCSKSGAKYTYTSSGDYYNILWSSPSYYIYASDSATLSYGEYGTNTVLTKVYTNVDNYDLCLKADYRLPLQNPPSEVDFNELDLNNNWDVNGTLFYSNVPYDPYDIAQAGGCNLKEKNCTVTATLKWRKTKIRVRYFCNGGKICQTSGNTVPAELVGKEDVNGVACHTGGWIIYNEEREGLKTNGLKDHNAGTTTGKLKMYNRTCGNSNQGGTRYYFIGNPGKTSKKIDEIHDTFDTYLDLIKWIRDKQKISIYTDSIVHHDTTVYLYAEYKNS